MPEDEELIERLGNPDNTEEDFCEIFSQFAINSTAANKSSSGTSSTASSPSKGKAKKVADKPYIDPTVEIIDWAYSEAAKADVQYAKDRRARKVAARIHNANMARDQALQDRAAAAEAINQLANSNNNGEGSSSSASNGAAPSTPSDLEPTLAALTFNPNQVKKPVTTKKADKTGAEAKSQVSTATNPKTASTGSDVPTPLTQATPQVPAMMAPDPTEKNTTSAPGEASHLYTVCGHKEYFVLYKAGHVPSGPLPISIDRRCRACEHKDLDDKWGGACRAAESVYRRAKSLAIAHVAAAVKDDKDEEKLKTAEKYKEASKTAKDNLDKVKEALRVAKEAVEMDIMRANWDAEKEAGWV